MTTTEELRAQVPDDCVELPEGALPCMGCGVAVPLGSSVTVTPVAQRDIPFSSCDACASIHHQAVAYVAEHPTLGQRGNIVVSHIESVLHAFKVLDREPPADLGLCLSRMQPAGHTLWFCSPSRMLKAGECAVRPYAHVSLTQRAELKTAFAGLLRDRVAATEPPVPIRCPSRGCLICGVGSLNRPAIAVHRAGGPQALARLIWRETNLKGQLGHACPDCARAIDAVGAVGQSAVERSLVAFVLADIGPTAAKRMRAWIDDDVIPPVVPWAKSGAKPSATPWFHLVKIIDRLPEKPPGRPRKSA